MLQFVKNAVRELRHVVWPTRKETHKFFWLTLTLLIVFGIYLFIFSQVFSETLFALKDIFWTGHSTSTPVDFDVSDIFTGEETIPEESVFADEEEVFIDTDNEASQDDEELASPEWDALQE